MIYYNLGKMFPASIGGGFHYPFSIGIESSTERPVGNADPCALNDGQALIE